MNEDIACYLAADIPSTRNMIVEIATKLLGVILPGKIFSKIEEEWIALQRT